MGEPQAMESYRALCSDYYVNQKFSLKLDLPKNRESVLDLFERIRRTHPQMDAFKRYKEELALESPSSEREHCWLAIRASDIRSGAVNPATSEDAYGLHRQVLEVAPYFLSISSLDVEYLELLYGFDLAATGNQDAIVHDALMEATPFGTLLDLPGARCSDCQPLFGVHFGDKGEFEASVEVKTRPSSSTGDSGEPISVYVTIRRYGSVGDLKELPAAMDEIAEHGERLVRDHLVSAVLAPLREAIISGGGS
ncbi:MAG: hypothetical protein AAGG07_03050 [Planctomycetota bacterium]